MSRYYGINVVPRMSITAQLEGVLHQQYGGDYNGDYIQEDAHTAAGVCDVAEVTKEVSAPHSFSIYACPSSTSFCNMLLVHRCAQFGIIDNLCTPPMCSCGWCAGVTTTMTTTSRICTNGQKLIRIGDAEFFNRTLLSLSSQREAGG